MIAFPLLMGLTVFLLHGNRCFMKHFTGSKLETRGRGYLFSLYTSDSSLHFSRYRFSSVMMCFISSHAAALKQPCWKCIYSSYLIRSNSKPSCLCSGCLNTDRKRQINKHLLVFRLICSLLNPVFSHDALHSVPGVSCVAWRGFLKPPGLQLTPLLIDICPFSISIVSPSKMPPPQQ